MPRTRKTCTANMVRNQLKTMVATTKARHNIIRVRANSRIIKEVLDTRNHTIIVRIRMVIRVTKATMTNEFLLIK
jgi:hypothetical protein